MKSIVLAAFNVETLPLARAFGLENPQRYGFTTRWSGKRFDLVQTNMGKVHAAAVTQYVIDHEKPDWIINVGIVGGFAKEVVVGDLVMPTGVIQYDMDLRKFGFPLGRIHAIKKIVLPLTVIPLEKTVYKKGICITADKLLSDKKEGNVVYKLFHPAIVDMELGSIAHVCLLNKIRLVALKSPVDIVEKEEVKSFQMRAARCMDVLIRGLDEVLIHL